MANMSCERCMQKQRKQISVMRALQITDAQRVEHAALWRTWCKRQAAIVRNLSRVLDDINSVLPQVEDVQLGLLCASAHLLEHECGGRGSAGTTGPAGLLDTVATGAAAESQYAVAHADRVTVHTCGHTDDVADDHVAADDSACDTYPPVEHMMSREFAAPPRGPVVLSDHACATCISDQMLEAQSQERAVPEWSQAEVAAGPSRRQGFFEPACMSDNKQLASPPRDRHTDMRRHPRHSATWQSAHSAGHAGAPASSPGKGTWRLPSNESSNALLLALVEDASGGSHSTAVTHMLPPGGTAQHAIATVTAHGAEAPSQHGVPSSMFGPPEPHGAPSPMFGSPEPQQPHSVHSTQQMVQRTRPAPLIGEAGNEPKLLGESGSGMHAVENVVSKLLSVSHSSMLLLSQSMLPLYKLTPVRSPCLPSPPCSLHAFVALHACIHCMQLRSSDRVCSTY